jgi:hypothetical protein
MTPLLVPPRVPFLCTCSLLPAPHRSPCLYSPLARRLFANRGPTVCNTVVEYLEIDKYKSRFSAMPVPQ